MKPRIFVTGEVLRPGPYVVRRQINVLQAIAVSGGFTLFAAKQRIQVRRRIDGREVMFLFDYFAFHSGRDVEGNIDLLPNDVVIVPETIDFNPSALISSRRSGAMVPRPPIMMPRLAKLAKPHIA